MRNLALLTNRIALVLIHLVAGALLMVVPGTRADAAILDPLTIPKYVSPMIIPPAMPKTSTIGGRIDYYEIAVRQFQQQILPSGFPLTTVWSYGSINHPETFNYPAFTIEAQVNKPVRVKWINDLKDPVTGEYLPHILPVDQTIHWANPAKDCIDGNPRTDCRGQSQVPYAGPVPIVTHLHGGHTGPKSDGYPEAWYLPAATNIPAGFAAQGTFFDQIAGVPVEPGAAVFQYRNDQPPTTLWYHDHSLGITRANVYAGPAGFYLLRDPQDPVAPLLPGPAPKRHDKAGRKYREIPIVIQDRTFNDDGSLFYPDNRALFENLLVTELLIPFIPDPAHNGISDVSPIWNPEFFGNTMVVNGETWPYLDVEKRRYRLRLLNGSNSRFLILKLVTGDPLIRPAQSALPFWQIGADGGYLKKPLKLDSLLVAPAERADVIVDFSKLPVGTSVVMINEAPDEPFGGGVPDIDFLESDPATTGQVMEFRVGRRTRAETAVHPGSLNLPKPAPLGPTANVRRISLNEEESATVLVVDNPDGSIVFDPLNPEAVPFGPTAAKLGTVTPFGLGEPRLWADTITENPALDTAEIWEIHNFTEDAHPIHLHQVQFKVIDRTPMGEVIGGPYTRKRENWEKGLKDTVIAYPGEITRVKARFDIAGLYVWHCHILEHEDNEMMRPYCVGNLLDCRPPGQ